MDHIATDTQIEYVEKLDYIKTMGGERRNMEEKTGLQISSMVTGICSSCLFWILGLPLGVVALALAYNAWKRAKYKGMTIAGLVTGICGVAFFFLYWLFIIVAMSSY